MGKEHSIEGPTMDNPDYLVENEARTVQNYYDPSFVTTLERQRSWTSFFIGDWDTYLPMAYSDRIIGRDVYRTFEGATACRRFLSL
jgi:hypothetical protein